MGCATKCFVVTLFISIVIGYFIYEISLPTQLPEFSLKYWGPGKEKPDDKKIKKFKISFPESEITELKAKLAKTRKLASPLEDVAFNYGVNSVYLNKFVEFWKTNYNWTEREAYLNKYPQFTTQIGGLDIHFVHVKPNAAKIKGKQVVPILLIHGWPDSIAGFYKMIPLLTTPRSDSDFVFEVVVPSLPGYGFSQAASKPGLHVAHIGLIFDELMGRLGFEKYYVQGGDWGSFIGHTQAILRPKRVQGFHSNLCNAATKKSKYYTVLFYLFPTIFLDEPFQERFTSQFSNLLLESGYFHLQVTKPDTVGVSLSDSPVGLAAYILEKFSTWTNGNWRSLPDGGLENLDKTELLDNIMIYWLTNSITTSMRLYKEFIEFYKLGILQNKVTVPTACAVFENEFMFLPETILKESFDKLVSVNFFPRGGHFAAFEEPKLLSEDVWNFVKISRSKPYHK